MPWSRFSDEVRDTLAVEAYIHVRPAFVETITE
jgi:hypothetical protein